MQRRQFLHTAAATTTALALAPLTRAASSAAEPVTPARRPPTPIIAAYYFRAQMYTCVPSQIRADMAWMASVGTRYVCVAILEQDLWAATENIDLIIAAAARHDMQVVAVPSRWAGLVAGAPKVPSIFCAMHPETWLVDRRGRTAVARLSTGVMSSVHAPATFDFFTTTLERLFARHPALAGYIIDEPKNFVPDYSPPAAAALGPDADRAAHLAATTEFWSRVNAFAAARLPDKLRLLFLQAYAAPDQIAAAAAVRDLHYFGADGRPWGPAEDARLTGLGPTQESGKGKILLGGPGQHFIDLARAEPGRRSYLLLENHNLTAEMIEPLDRNYPAVLALGADWLAYYYYPRNVADPDRVMDLIAGHLRRL